MTPESWDKVDSTLTPRLLNLTLQSEMSENSLVCVTRDGWPSIYSSPRPAGLGFLPLGTALLLDIPDALLVSVIVALVWGLIVRGRPAWPQRVSSLYFTDLMINACALSREVFSVKTHRRAATGNTRSREASRTAGGSRFLGQRPRSLAHALAWWSAMRATWPIPDQEGVEVVVSYFPACIAMSNVSPSHERLLTWLPRSARRADGASALGQTCPRTRLDLRVPLRIGWKKPIALFNRSDLLIFKRLVRIR
jgi:hypothetical protein